MKLLITEYRQPDWPFTKLPHFRQEARELQEGLFYRPRIGWALDSVLVIADGHPLPVHVHPGKAECKTNCPANEKYTEPE